MKRDNYNLHLMGKDELVWMYFDSHTTIRKVFLERMNRARNNYLRSSKNANIVFKSYMGLKQDRKNHTINLDDFKYQFKRAKRAYIKSANEVKRAKRLYKYYQRQYDEVCNRLPNELLNMEIGKYE